MMSEFPTMRPTPQVARMFAVAVLAAVLVPAAPFAVAQSKRPQEKTLTLPDLFNQGGNAEGDAFGPKVSSSLSPKTVKTGDVVTLSVTLELPLLAHVAPQKSKSDFGLPTKLHLKSLVGLQEIDKEFTTKKKPKTQTDPETGLKEIYFEGTITWTKKLRIVDAAKLKTVTATGSIRYQVCTGGLCKPPKTATFAAKAAVGPSQQPKTTEPGKAGVTTKFPFKKQLRPFRFGKNVPVDLSFELSPRNAAPGESVTLTITAKLDKGWHAFALTHQTHPDSGTGKPVIIDVLKVRGLEPTGKGWRPNKAPKSHIDKAGHELREHYGTVVWKRTFRVTPGLSPGDYGLAGKFFYQLCDESSCLAGHTIRFSLGDVTSAIAAPADSNLIDKSPFPAPVVTERPPVEAANLAWYLLLAFCGGLILNVMPCVLPVIAIKVMSFVQQAGEDRKRIFVLNSVYACGVISVFLLLATLAVWLGLGWGGLFQRAEFTLIMGVVVFAMGLSLLGVFEIPLPGFLGSAAGKQHSEGPAGAFLTGVFATILATPCSGPFLGVTLAWSVRQLPHVTYLVWATMGLGMAFPYLVFALSPRATKLLPKPGNWMVRFKEISGFVLMGTTVWIVQSLKKPELFYTLILVASTGFSLWMVGKLYLPTTPRPQKWSIRMLALAVVTFAAFAGSHVLEHVGPDGSPMFQFLQRWDMLSAATVFLGVSFAVLPFRAAMNAAITAGRRWMLQGTATVLVLLAVFGAYFAQTFAELPWQPYTEQTLNDSVAKGNIVLIDFTADW